MMMKVVSLIQFQYSKSMNISLEFTGLADSVNMICRLLTN